MKNGLFVINFVLMYSSWSQHLFLQLSFCLVLAFQPFLGKSWIQVRILGLEIWPSVTLLLDVEGL